VITSVYIDRPAVLAPLLPMSTSVIANFGLSDEALVAIITGREKAVGRLPFELPSSMQAVLNQRSDQPSDSASPLFEVGFTLPY
jgi:beta-glucosidase